MTIAKIEMEKRNKWLEDVRSQKLNTPLSIILRKFKNLGILRTPKSLINSPKKCDKSKICDSLRSWIYNR